MIFVSGHEAIAYEKVSRSRVEERLFVRRFVVGKIEFENLSGIFENAAAFESDSDK